MPKYYQIEAPIAVNSEGGSFEYYPEAKRFAIALTPWFDSQGQKCRGKTVSLPLERFKEHSKPLIELFNMVIMELKKERNENDEN